MWEFERNGEYSIRSAYRLCKEVRKSTIVGESSNSAVEKKIWKLKLSNKMNIFTWRLCKNSLPTRQKLKLFKVITNAVATYPFFREHIKDLYHAIFGCPDLIKIYRNNISHVYSILIWDEMHCQLLIRFSMKGCGWSGEDDIYSVSN